jgi:hypothetical protein
MYEYNFFFSVLMYLRVGLLMRTIFDLLQSRGQTSSLTLANKHPLLPALLVWRVRNTCLRLYIKLINLMGLNLR